MNLQNVINEYNQKVEEFCQTVGEIKSYKQTAAVVLFMEGLAEEYIKKHNGLTKKALFEYSKSNLNQKVVKEINFRNQQ